MKMTGGGVLTAPSIFLDWGGCNVPQLILQIVVRTILQCKITWILTCFFSNN